MSTFVGCYSTHPYQQEEINIREEDCFHIVQHIEFPFDKIIQLPLKNGLGTFIVNGAHIYILDQKGTGMVRTNLIWINNN